MIAAYSAHTPRENRAGNREKPTTTLVRRNGRIVAALRKG